MDQDFPAVGFGISQRRFCGENLEFAIPSATAPSVRSFERKMLTSMHTSEETPFHTMVSLSECDRRCVFLLVPIPDVAL